MYYFALKYDIIAIVIYVSKKSILNVYIFAISTEQIYTGKDYHFFTIFFPNVSLQCFYRYILLYFIDVVTNSCNITNANTVWKCSLFNYLCICLVDRNQRKCCRSFLKGLHYRKPSTGYAVRPVGIVRNLHSLLVKDSIIVRYLRFCENQVEYESLKSCSSMKHNQSRRIPQVWLFVFVSCNRNLNRLLGKCAMSPQWPLNEFCWRNSSP